MNCMKKKNKAIFFATVFILVSLLVFLNYIKGAEYDKFINENTIRSEDQLDDSISVDDISLIYFYSPKCDYCKKIKKKLVPKLKRLKEKNIKFYCFDVSYDKELIKSKYGLEYVPALILYDNSNELKRLIDGIFDSNVLDKYFEYIEVLYES